MIIVGRWCTPLSPVMVETKWVWLLWESFSFKLCDHNGCFLHGCGVPIRGDSWQVPEKVVAGLDGRYVFVMHHGMLHIEMSVSCLCPVFLDLNELRVGVVVQISDNGVVV